MSLWILIFLSSCTHTILIYLLPYIHIDIYTTIRIYALRTKHPSDLPTVFILHSLLSILPFPFLVSTSLFVRLQSSIDFYSAKVSQAGNTANTGMLPIGGKVFMTLRNHRLRFPENFTSQFFALGSLNTCELTLHIKGSR